MDKKYGVYICEGCGIGESLDDSAQTAVPKMKVLQPKPIPFCAAPKALPF
jgi:quinone-modifying oxidoreductase, subunit QmoB